MKHTLSAALALACLTTSSFALAAAQAASAPNFVATSAATASSAKAAGSASTPGTPMANIYRAYPPSCASYPLPDKPSGPTYTGTATAFANPTGYYNGWYFSGTEALTITVWRLPCSSSGAAVPYNTAGAKNAMTLVRIDRANDSTTATVPIMPQILVFQGDIDASNAGAKKNVRLATEPNTVLSDRKFGSAYDLLATSTTFVLENYLGSDAAHFNFNDTFMLQVNAGSGAATINVPAYAPTPDTYPTAGAPLPFDGYAGKQWIATDHGLLVQVTEQYDSSGAMFRQLVTDLEIQNPDGTSQWLFANRKFDAGATSVTANLNYRTDAQTLMPWGTAKYVLVDCNHLDVTYTPMENLPEDAPAQDLSGTVHYDVLFNVNGMVCE